MSIRREPLLEEEITHKAIGAMYTVHNRMGYGFLEAPYIGALQCECGKRGLRVEREKPIDVYYDDIAVGFYRIDLILDSKVIVEVKTSKPHEDHIYQLLNYLRCSDVEVGLLMYFRRNATFKRAIFRNELKRCRANQTAFVNAKER